VGLYQKASSGAEKEDVLLSPTNSAKLPNDWSRSGQFLLYSIQDPKTNADLWVLPLTADGQPSAAPAPFANTKFNEQQGQFSPDGHWIAYASDESGRHEVYVRPFPSGPGKWQISISGGELPRWRRDGKELYFMSLLSLGSMLASDIRVSSFSRAIRALRASSHSARDTTCRASNPLIAFLLGCTIRLG
jgi:Tol biopolymer transport system component